MNIGFVTMTMMLLNSIKVNNLLSRQVINNSCTCANKPFVAINAAKCRTEDVG